MPRIRLQTSGGQQLYVQIFSDFFLFRTHLYIAYTKKGVTSFPFYRLTPSPSQPSGTHWELIQKAHLQCRHISVVNMQHANISLCCLLIFQVITNIK